MSKYIIPKCYYLQGKSIRIRLLSKLTSDEKDYFKLELLDKNGGCINNNITCKDGFDYYLKLKDIDQIISDIKKQRETKKLPQATPTIENPLNKKFWELIQK